MAKLSRETVIWFQEECRRRLILGQTNAVKKKKKEEKMARRIMSEREREREKHHAWHKI